MPQRRSLLVGSERWPEGIENESPSAAPAMAPGYGHFLPTIRRG
jgi:hypothetical protein